MVRLLLSRFEISGGGFEEAFSAGDCGIGVGPAFLEVVEIGETIPAADGAQMKVNVI
jgi:hypothetical protein